MPQAKRRSNTIIDGPEEGTIAELRRLTKEAAQRHGDRAAEQLRRGHADARLGPKALHAVGAVGEGMAVLTSPVEAAITKTIGRRIFPDDEPSAQLLGETAAMVMPLGLPKLGKTRAVEGIVPRVGHLPVSPHNLLSENRRVHAKELKEWHEEGGHESVQLGRRDKEWEQAEKEGLDLSDEARYARAREMGFNTEEVWWHGASRGQRDDFSTDGKTNYSGRSYFTSDLGVAKMFGNTKIPVFLRSDRLLDGNNPEHLAILLRELKALGLQELSSWNAGRPYWGAFDNLVVRKKLQARLQELGFDGIRLSGEGSEGQVAVWNRKAIRSPDAVFDPRKERSGNIYAGARQRPPQGPKIYGQDRLDPNPIIPQRPNMRDMSGGVQPAGLKLKRSEGLDRVTRVLRDKKLLSEEEYQAYLKDPESVYGDIRDTIAVMSVGAAGGQAISQWLKRKKREERERAARINERLNRGTTWVPARRRPERMPTMLDGHEVI